MAKNKPTQAQTDPLADIKVADEATQELVQFDAPVVADLPPVVDASTMPSVEPVVEGPVVAEITAEALAAEKAAAAQTEPPPVPPLYLPKYRVIADKRIFWKGQQINMKAGKIIKPENYAPGAIDHFIMCGVQLEQIA